MMKFHIWLKILKEDLKEYFETEFARINTLNQDFVDIVRASGSNNAKRWLVVQPHNTQIAALMQDIFEFKIPQDITVKNRIMPHIPALVHIVNCIIDAISFPFAIISAF